MAEQLGDRFGHVLVAQVPGLHVPAAAAEPSDLLEKVDELLHHRVLARGDHSQRGAPRVLLDGAPEVIEAAVALARDPRLFRIDFLQLLQYLVDRGVQAVEVEAIEPDLGGAWLQAVVVGAQPAHEIEHVRVAPHPGGEPLETGERGIGIPVFAFAADEAVHAVRVGPVGFDRDGVEPFLDDQPLGDASPLLVELVGAMRCLAEKDQAGVSNGVDQRVVRIRIRQRMNGLAQRLEHRDIRVDHGVPSAASPRPPVERRVSWTSSSLVGKKSSYQSPTAWKGSGVAAQTMRSTSRARSSQLSGEAMGTATTISRGPCRRSASTAARMVEPVARPSSTSTTVRPATSMGGRSPRNSRSRRSSSRCSRAATRSMSARVTPWAMTSGLSTRTPPLAMAPMATSSWPGKPSLRTTNTSSGARSRRATSQ